ncbi:hypothetical protein H5410_036669, partial [Solanum commersonii]
MRRDLRHLKNRWISPTVKVHTNIIMKTRHRLGKHDLSYISIVSTEFPIENRKALQFISSSKQFKTKGGLAAGTATTN